MHRRIKLRSDCSYKELQKWSPQLVPEGLACAALSLLRSRFGHDVGVRSEAGEATEDGGDGAGDAGAGCATEDGVAGAATMEAASPPSMCDRSSAED